jgi:hypothetical protein
MTKVTEERLLKFREELTEQLTACEPDMDVLSEKIQGYVSLLPEYNEQLLKELPQPEVENLLKKELLFVQQVTSSLDDLRSARKEALLTVVKGRKATSKY